MGTLRSSTFWWDRARCAHVDVPELEAVIFSLDGVLAGAHGDAHLFREFVWSLHCAGIRIAIVTDHHDLQVHRTVRELLGDGAVEVMITSDEVDHPRPHPEIYRCALAELGVRSDHAMAVEDSADGLRAARGAGLATVVVTTERTREEDFTGAAAVIHGYGGTEPLSVHRCRRLREQWWMHHRTALSA